MATNSAPAGNNSQAKAPVLLPFRGGTQSTTQRDGYTNSVTLSTATQDLPNYTPSPNNLLRGLAIECKCTASGNSATVAFNGDAPFNVFSSLTFADANDKPILGPFDGYTLAMVNKYSGFENNPDPRASAVYSVTTGSGGTGGSFNFVLHVPIEAVTRTGVGSLQNQSSNSTFQLKMTVNTEASIYSTNPTSAPSVSVTVTEFGYWKGANSGYASTPKAAGSTMYFTRGTFNSLNGAQQIQLPQGLGYPIRNIIEINYATGAARSTADFPTVPQYIYKGSNLFNSSVNLWQDLMSRWYDLESTTLDAANALDTGVLVLPFMMDFTNQPGSESGLGYLPTDQGDLFQLIGTWSASSTLYHVVSYIAPVGPVTVLQAGSN